MIVCVGGGGRGEEGGRRKKRKFLRNRHIFLSERDRDMTLESARRGMV